jgi:hypothetical protein
MRRKGNGYCVLKAELKEREHKENLDEDDPDFVVFAISKV